ncbi:MAG: TIGR02266 family protein, partial [Deltaproteobacteria bacterium]|nr:TIGR02266 family protein [Kofleriaceae bacterium]
MDTTTRQAKRAPVTLKIKFKSATLDQFIERYAVDVSPGGIFIRTKEPLAVGTQMRFEFQLRDATPLITGEGTVVWTRENDPSRPSAAPGMGVRFDRLGDGSQTVLDKILAEKAKQPTTGGSAGPEGAPKGFLEVPTKVAPSPLVGALASETKPKLGGMAPKAGGFIDERTDNTPLPRPMPFHSDAEEFPEEAFEEATKVRSLDALAAQTAIDTGNDAPARKPAAEKPQLFATPERVAEPAIDKPAEKPAPALAAVAEKVADKPVEKPAAAVAAVAEKPAAATIVSAAPPPAKSAEAPRLVPASEKAKVDKPAVAAATATPISTQAIVEPSSRAPTAVIIGLLLAALVA